MRNIKLIIRYDGTNYSGWQSQKNSVSIQDTVRAAIKKVTGSHAVVTASGRTDAGVHALAQVVNFRTVSKIPLQSLRMALNTVLPDDIVVSRAEETTPGFNSQRDARSKLYRYAIYNKDFVDPFLRHYTSRCSFKLNTTLMRRGAKYLVGRHDFTSFRTKDHREKNAVRAIKRIKVARRGDIIYIDVEADGFLYNMVRNIVGTLIDVGRGRFKAEYVREIIKKKDRRLCGPTAPAKGLSLVKVRY